MIVEHATCLACGCLCDDIRVVVAEGRVIEAENACAIGRPWFLAPRPGEGHPSIAIDGQAADFADALDRASLILQNAKAPVVWGLSGTTIEAVASALAIADAIGAVVDLPGSADQAAKLAAFQRVGQVSATLGEVKDRADVVVFWGVDPVATHPRHWERYSVEPRGRFVPEGRPGRFVVAVDSKRTATAEASNLFLKIDPDRQAETLLAIRALIRGVGLASNRLDRSTGLPLAALQDLADRFRNARYGAFFFGETLGQGRAGVRAIEAALTLVRDLNEGRRFIALGLGEPGNPSGAGTVLGWQAGAPSDIDYGRGYPRHLPGESRLASRLESDEVDAVLIVADDPSAVLSAPMLARLANIPTIRIAPGATVPGLMATVAFDVARPGIEVGGTVARVDGVMLPLRPALDAGLASDRQILDAIKTRICASR